MKDEKIRQMERDLREMEDLKAKIDDGTATPQERSQFDRLADSARVEAMASVWGGVAGLAAILVIAAWWFSGSDEREADHQEAEQRREAEASSPASLRRQAVYVCEQGVTERLLDPESARFVSGRAISDDEQSFTVAGTVVASNRLGGMADTPYECGLSLIDGRWYTNSVSIGE